MHFLTPSAIHRSTKSPILIRILLIYAIILQPLERKNWKKNEIQQTFVDLTAYKAITRFI